MYVTLDELKNRKSIKKLEKHCQSVNNTIVLQQPFLLANCADPNFTRPTGSNDRNKKRTKQISTGTANGR